MSRLSATLSCDLRLQIRYGFLYAGLLVAAVWMVLLRFVPGETLSLLLPVFLFFNVNITTFYFLAGLVLFEKGEGTLEALVTTPLRPSEYLLSKILALSLFAGVESLVIVLIGYGADFRWLPLIAGMLLLCAQYCLIGFLTVVRYDSISEYLIPSSLIMFAIQLPFLDALGIVESPLFYLWPTHAPLLLLRGAFGSIGVAEAVYGVLYASLWTVVLALAAGRSFHRFVVRREGVRA